MDRRGFFFQAEDGIRDKLVTGVQTCALPILPPPHKYRTARAVSEAGCQVLAIAARRWWAESSPGLPFPRMHAAIYVQDFTSGERGVRQEQNCIYDFFDFTH